MIIKPGSSEPGKGDQEIRPSQNKLGIQNPGQSWVAEFSERTRPRDGSGMFSEPAQTNFI